MKFSAEDVYNKLIEDNILEEKGKVTFSFAGINVDIESNDIVGNIIQAWLREWFLSNDIEFDVPENTQEFPDFYLNINDKTEDLLEVKAFNYNNSPGFDIANFESYCESVMTKPYRFHAKYLIFGYKMIGSTITIEKIWLKNIWEITSYMRDFPLTVQNKRGIIYNIRPAKWYGKTSRETFSCLEDFIAALYRSLVLYNDKSRIDPVCWAETTINNYNNYFHSQLEISNF